MNREQPTLCVISPTVSKPTLLPAMESIAAQRLIPGDQVLVVGDGLQPTAQAIVEKLGAPFKYMRHGPTRNFGNEQRTFAFKHATASYLCFMDDDNVFVPGAFDVIRSAILESARVAPLIFRVVMPDGNLLWESKALRINRIDGHCIVTPNVKHKVPPWGTRYAGDYDFALKLQLIWGAFHWREEVIAHLRPGSNAKPIKHLPK